MDKLKAKRSLYASLADDVAAKSLEDTRKKYSTGIPALDAVSQSQDAAVDAAQLPDAGLIAGTAGVAKDADKWAAENAKALADLEEDEEMAKWTAKQKG